MVRQLWGAGTKPRRRPSSVYPPPCKAVFAHPVTPRIEHRTTPTTQNDCAFPATATFGLGSAAQTTPQKQNPPHAARGMVGASGENITLLGEG
jgi:hypothetical protein